MTGAPAAEGLTVATGFELPAHRRVRVMQRVGVVEIERAVAAGSRVLMSGAGPIGLVSAQVALAFGAREVVVRSRSPSAQPGWSTRTRTETRHRSGLR